MRGERSFAVAAAGALILAGGLSCSGKPRETTGQAASLAAPAVEDMDVASRNHRPAGDRRPVIWLGLDGLDWELLDRLAAQGKMPNWKRLASKAYTARLRSFAPLISPIL